MCRILLIADRAADGHLLGLLLGQISTLRCELQQTSTQEAERAISRENYCLYLLDFTDRNSRREELLAALQASDRAIPIILLTAAAEAGIAALQQGGTDYWDKEHLSVSLIERSLRLILTHKRAIAAVEEESQANQKALQLNEQRLHSIFSSLEDAIWSIDPRINKLLYLNSAVKDIYGRTLSEFFENIDLLRLTIHPDDREGVLRADRALRKTKKFDIDYRILRPDGTIRWLQERTCVIEDEQGKVARHDSIATDITDRKQIEADLRESESRLRLITDTLPVCISYVDAEQCYRFVNKNYTTWFGYRPQEIYGRHLRDILGTEAYEVVRDRIERALAGESISYEAEVPYQQGGTRYVMSRVCPDIDANAQVRGYFALIEDISDRKQAENRLRDRLALETALAQVSRQLAASDEIAFNDLLQNLGQAVGASRAYLLRCQDTESFEILHAWCDPQIISQCQQGQHIDLGQFPWWREQLEAGCNLVVPNVDALSPEAIAEQNYWRSLRITSTLLVPIYTQSGQLWGQLGFDSASDNPKVWTPDDAQLLRVVGEMLSGYWAKQQRLADRSRQAQYQKLLAQVTFKIRQSLELEDILQTTVTELQAVLKADRVIFWQMTSDSEGWVVNEAVSPEFPSMRGQNIGDVGYGNCTRKYRSGRIHICPDVELADFDPCYLEFLRTYRIRANLILPILVAGEFEGEEPKSPDAEMLKPKLWGLLCTQQCSTSRNWTQYEIEFLQQLSSQVSIALSQAQLLAQQRRYAQELARSNRELEQFAYVASHDLQEPLRGVISFAAILAEEYQDRLDADARQYLDFIVDGATRMRQLIKDLLAFSRLGTRTVKLAATDCEAAIAQVLANLKIAIAESDAIVTHDPLPTVRADTLQLVQLWQNLIGNAIKFCTQDPPRIHLSATSTDEGWLFSVRDNGIGIDPQYSQRIFAIFQRLHAQQDYEGTGMGLAICQKIVQRHGGRIWVESAPQQGAVFYFTLPHRIDSS